MSAQQWPSRKAVIDEILTIAEPYARAQRNIDHPEDIANALIVAIEVAWRAVKQVEA